MFSCDGNLWGAQVLVQLAFNFSSSEDLSILVRCEYSRCARVTRIRLKVNPNIRVIFDLLVACTFLSRSFTRFIRAADLTSVIIRLNRRLQIITLHLCSSHVLEHKAESSDASTSFPGDCSKLCPTSGDFLRENPRKSPKEDWVCSASRKH